jgi:GAF domain-containing protein
MPLSAQSIAGSVAVSGAPLTIDDAYSLPVGSTFAFDPSFDRTSGYRTRSILAVPMTTVDGRVVGVLQLINRKHHSDAVLTSAAVVERAVGPFDAQDERIALALASQAAVAVENRRLMETDRLYQALQEYVREVSKVIVAAGEVEAGAFDPDSLESVADRDDALGQLARTFQRMAREVQAREARLREQVQQLRIEIDSTRKAGQVAAITGTAYFQDLKRAARELRDKQ